MRNRLGITISLLIGLGCPCAGGDRLVVHEWGTFTSFQNESGESLRRINTDDEPVPTFVHRLAKVRLFAPTDIVLDRQNLSQGAPQADPRVTMRLETPVVYFHLPPGQKAISLDVSVDFRNGLLTEFFPQAQPLVNGEPFEKDGFPPGPIVSGSLRWTNVRLGEQRRTSQMPQTTDHVWLAPRKVDAALVNVGTESERFLFYRGVGDLAAPLKVIRRLDGMLDVQLNVESMSAAEPSSPRGSRLDRPTARGFYSGIADHRHREWQAMLAHRDVWLLDVRRNGTSAFRRWREPTPSQTSADPLLKISSHFDESHYSIDNLAALRTEMHEALIREGLFADEAQALLETWELSYFRSPGQRLFFMVPRAWTDAFLPLHLSVPADVTRVMVGRIELVTPQQRELLKKLSDTPVPDLIEVTTRMKALKQDKTRREDYNALASGRGDSLILGVPVPPTYQAFLDLGRFRTSLLMDAADQDRKNSTASLGRLNHLVFELLNPGKLKRE